MLTCAKIKQCPTFVVRFLGDTRQKSCWSCVPEIFPMANFGYTANTPFHVVRAGRRLARLLLKYISISIWRWIGDFHIPLRWDVIPRSPSSPRVRGTS